MDIVNLLRDNNIQLASEHDRHHRPGWVNMPCPFCTGNPGNHLGYDVSGNKFHCWRCGGKQTNYTISTLLHIPLEEANNLLRQYGYYQYTKPAKVRIRKKAHKLPSNTSELNRRQKQYLTDRGFDADYIIKKYGLKATGPVSMLDNINFAYRIIIPIHWNEERVSFTGRDYTDKQKEKYKTCPKDRELTFHKEILYGEQKKWGEVGICTEGPTDVWRMQENSFCTFGIKYTSAQLRLIAKTFKRVPVVFDPDPQAQEQAKILVDELRFRGVDSFNVEIPTDPGSLSQTEANYLIKQLI